MRASAIDVSSMSNPCTTASGYRRASACVDQPAPQARSATRDGPVLSRSSISGTAASQPPSSCANAGRLNAAWASTTSAG